jgi:exonuclease-1
MSYLARKDYGNARMHLSRAIDVSPKMAAELIALCKEIRPQVRCLVAPYEADAQLAYLCSAGLVDAVITEDSDTVPYFCKEVRT